jgi:hypothetical protein
VYRGCDGEAPAPSSVLELDGACSGRYRVYAVGAATTPPAPLYLKVGSSCPMYGAPPQTDWYQLGTELPPSAFVKQGVLTE